MLTAYQNVKPDEGVPVVTLARQHRSVGMMQTTVTKNTGKYGRDDLQQLVEELRKLLDTVQSQLAVVSGVESPLKNRPTFVIQTDPP